MGLVQYKPRKQNPHRKTDLSAPFVDKEPSQEVIRRSTKIFEKEIGDKNDEVSNDENDHKDDKLSGRPD